MKNIFLLLICISCKISFCQTPAYKYPNELPYRYDWCGKYAPQYLERDIKNKKQWKKHKIKSITHIYYGYRLYKDSVLNFIAKFDREGNIIEKDYFSLFSFSGKSIYKYDQFGNINYVFAYLKDSLFHIDTIAYDKYGNHLYFKYRVEYDNSGRIKFYYKPDNVLFLSFDYNSKGDLIAVNEYSGIYKNFVITKDTFIYNDKRRIVVESEFNFIHGMYVEGKDTSFKDEKRFVNCDTLHYDKKGREIFSTSTIIGKFSAKYKNGKVVETKLNDGNDILVYNKKGDLIERKTFVNGELLQKDKYIYEYYRKRDRK